MSLTSYCDACDRALLSRLECEHHLQTCQPYCQQEMHAQAELEEQLRDRETDRRIDAARGK